MPTLAQGSDTTSLDFFTTAISPAVEIDFPLQFDLPLHHARTEGLAPLQQLTGQGVWRQLVTPDLEYSTNLNQFDRKYNFTGHFAIRDFGTTPATCATTGHLTFPETAEWASEINLLAQGNSEIPSPGCTSERYKSTARAKDPTQTLKLLLSHTEGLAPFFNSLLTGQGERGNDRATELATPLTDKIAGPASTTLGTSSTWTTNTLDSLRDCYSRFLTGEAYTQWSERAHGKTLPLGATKFDEIDHLPVIDTQSSWQPSFSVQQPVYWSHVSASAPAEPLNSCLPVERWQHILHIIFISLPFVLILLILHRLPTQIFHCLPGFPVTCQLPSRRFSPKRTNAQVPITRQCTKSLSVRNSHSSCKPGPKSGHVLNTTRNLVDNAFSCQSSTCTSNTLQIYSEHGGEGSSCCVMRWGGSLAFQPYHLEAFFQAKHHDNAPPVGYGRVGCPDSSIRIVSLRIQKRSFQARVSTEQFAMDVPGTEADVMTIQDYFPAAAAHPQTQHHATSLDSADQPSNVCPETRAPTTPISSSSCKCWGTFIR